MVAVAVIQYNVLQSMIITFLLLSKNTNSLLNRRLVLPQYVGSGKISAGGWGQLVVDNVPPGEDKDDSNSDSCSPELYPVQLPWVDGEGKVVVHAIPANVRD